MAEKFGRQTELINKLCFELGVEADILGFAMMKHTKELCGDCPLIRFPDSSMHIFSSKDNMVEALIIAKKVKDGVIARSEATT